MKRVDLNKLLAAIAISSLIIFAIIDDPLTMFFVLIIIALIGIIYHTLIKDGNTRPRKKR